MKTNFGLRAQQFRFQGLILSFLLMLSFATDDFFKNPIFFTTGIIFFLLLGLCILWMYPYIEIKDKGIVVKRIFIERYYTFDVLDFDIKRSKLLKILHKENSKIFGIDQRYGMIKINDSNIFCQHVYLTSHMRNFEDFISKLKKALSVKSKQKLKSSVDG
jgi:hypothetical protein